MMRHMCKSKIHRATVTEANLDYMGSVTIDEELMRKANILPYERVQVVDIDNGQRLETYAIKGEGGSGVICLNGAAARLVNEGDKVIIISYAMFDEKELETYRPKVVFVDERNRAVNVKEDEPPMTCSPDFSLEPSLMF